MALSAKSAHRWEGFPSQTDVMEFRLGSMSPPAKRLNSMNSVLHDRQRPTTPLRHSHGTHLKLTLSTRSIDTSQRKVLHSTSVCRATKTTRRIHEAVLMRGAKTYHEQHSW